MSPTSIRQQRYRAANRLIHRSWAWMQRNGAVGPGSRAAERFGSFGEGSIVGYPWSTMYGEAQIHIGRDTLISAWTTLVTGYGPDQTTVPPRALVIGDRCVLGLRCGIVAHESITIGDDVWFGQEIYVTDANHGFSDLTVPFGRQLGPHEPVTIGDGTWIGHGAVILPGSSIGKSVVVAAGAVVRGDVPDFSVVGGVPAKVIRTLS
jgi:acetyltransferase-like isoleucine patch superfamily enzyme